MQRLIVRLTLIIMATVALPAAAGDWAANASLSSDNTFRGLDLNNGFGAAAGVDAGFNPTYGASPYLGGTAASNRNAGGSEIDVYGGASRSAVFHELYPYTVDAGVIGYLFPQDADGLRHRGQDAAELYAGLSVGPANVKLWLSPDYFGAGAPGGYVRGRLRWPITTALSVVGAVGIAAGPGVRQYTAALTDDRRGSAYADAEAAIEYSWRYGVSFRAAVTAVTLDLGEQATGGRDAVRVSFGLRKDFDLGGF